MGVEMVLPSEDCLLGATAPLLGDHGRPNEGVETVWTDE